MIIFYNMPGCGFCQKAQEILSEYIKNKSVVVKNYKEAPSNVNGFPYFVNTENKKSYTGLPSSVEKLFQELDAELRENFACKTQNNFYKLKNWQGVL